MKERTKTLLYLAYTNAAELIIGHAETGLAPDDLGFEEDDEKALEEYSKACKKVASLLELKSKKYQ